MKASKPVGPILLPLPPAGGPQVAQWEVAAVKMLADAGRLPGYARVRIRVGLVDDERRLPDLLPPIGAALTRARLVDDELVADLEAAWDRVVPAGSVVISVFPTTGASNAQRRRDQGQGQRGAAPALGRGARQRAVNPSRGDRKR